MQLNVVYRLLVNGRSRCIIEEETKVDVEIPENVDCNVVTRNT